MNFCEAFWFIFRKKVFFSIHRNDSWSKRCFPRLYLSKYKNVEGKNYYLLLSWGAASSVALPMHCSLMLPYPRGPAAARGWHCKGLAMPSQRPGGREMQLSILLLALCDRTLHLKGNGRQTLKSSQVKLLISLKKKKLDYGRMSKLP